MKRNQIAQLLGKITVQGLMWTVIIVLIYHLSGCK